MKDEYNELIEAFTNLSTEAKIKEIIETLKQDIAILQNLCEKYNFPSDLLINKEMVKADVSDIDDICETIFAYVKSFEEILGNFIIYYSELK